VAGRAGLHSGMRCVAGWARPAGVYAVIPIYPCWRRAVGGRAAGEDLYRLGRILLTLPAATEYIPTWEGQILLTVLDKNQK
jgi:hypothetical protein